MDENEKIKNRIKDVIEFAANQRTNPEETAETLTILTCALVHACRSAGLSQGKALQVIKEAFDSYGELIASDPDAFLAFMDNKAEF